MMGNQIAFIALAAITVVSAALVVILPNVLRSALFLAFCFMGVAGLYVTLNAEFLAAMQILIYVGAITVLIMFALVLTQQLMGAKLRTTSRAIWAGGPVAILAFLFFLKSFVKPFSGSQIITRGIADAAPAPANADTIRSLAQMLLQPYVLPFELASLILLAALVGAIVIAKEEKG